MTLFAFFLILFFSFDIKAMDHLDDDAQISIYGWLDVRSLGRLSQTSTFMRAIVDKNPMWIHHCQGDFPWDPLLIKDTMSKEEYTEQENQRCCQNTPWQRTFNRTLIPEFMTEDAQNVLWDRLFVGSMPWERLPDYRKTLSWKDRYKLNKEIHEKEQKVVSKLTASQIIIQKMVIKTAELQRIRFTSKPYMSVALGRRGIFSLPDIWEKFSDVEVLDLGKNRIGTLPTSMEKLTNLRNLCLNGNFLNRFPETLFKLPQIKTIALSSNNMTELPENMGVLENLEILYLGGNHLKTLPKSVENLEKLYILDLSHNQFESFPKNLKMYQMEKPTALKIGCNPLHSLKEDVHALLSTLTEQQDFSLVLCEEQYKSLGEDPEFPNVTLLMDTYSPCVCKKV
ncbi:MAG: leucine-rich repeat domain-containing protein [Alphaproteobacteria bacterium]|nr:leucine-rich repeat domain-containing protein [Alphaproteobacteria bacterium]